MNKDEERRAIRSLMSVYIQELTKLDARLKGLNPDNLPECRTAELIEIHDELMNLRMQFAEGTVTLTKMTSKGFALSEKRHYYNPAFRKYKGRDILVHKSDGCLKAYLYDADSGRVGDQICFLIGGE